MGVITFRGSGELSGLIAQAQGGDTGNQSAAIRALILLGADRLELDLSGLQHEIVMLMMEQMEPKVIEELRALLGGIPPTLPQRPHRPATRAASQTSRRQATRAIPAEVPAPQWQPPPMSGPPVIAGVPPPVLGMPSDTYNIGEEI